MSINNTEKRGKSDRTGIIFLIVAVLLAAFMSPSILIINLALDIIGYHFDVGQHWIFAVFLTIIIIAGLRLLTTSWSSAFAVWGVLCICVVMLGLLCHFGFHAEWPSRYVSHLIPKESSGTTNATLKQSESSQ